MKIPRPGRVFAWIVGFFMGMGLGHLCGYRDGAKESLIVAKKALEEGQRAADDGELMKHVARIAMAHCGDKWPSPAQQP